MTVFRDIASNDWQQRVTIAYCLPSALHCTVLKRQHAS